MKHLRLACLALASSLALSACGSTGPHDDVASHASQGVTTSQLDFAGDFGAVTPSPALTAGGRVRIHFDRSRMYEIVDGESQMGYFASRYHCYGYGCCEVEFGDVRVHYRFQEAAEFTETGLDAADGMELDIPQDASRLELWFDAPGFEIRTWYCGCDAGCAKTNYDQASPRWESHATYDSAYGQNYVFAVTPGGEGGPHGEVQRLADGQWTSDWAAPSGVSTGWQWNANVWVDVAVENLAFEKTVGVRWTVDGWATEHDTLGEYEAPLNGGYEQWGVDITPAMSLQSCYACTPEAPTFEYAIFYTVDGATYWDSNGGLNYALAIPGTY